MLIEAVYEQGKLIFDQNIRLKRDRFHVRVELPEDVLVSEKTEQPSVPTDPWLSRLEEIRQRVMTTPEDELPEITGKDEEYIQAFLLREER